MTGKITFKSSLITNEEGIDLTTRETTILDMLKKADSPRSGEWLLGGEETPREFLATLRGLADKVSRISEGTVALQQVGRGYYQLVVLGEQVRLRLIQKAVEHRNAGRGSISCVTFFKPCFKSLEKRADTVANFFTANDSGIAHPVQLNARRGPSKDSCPCHALG